MDGKAGRYGIDYSFIPAFFVSYFNQTERIGIGLNWKQSWQFSWWGATLFQICFISVITVLALRVAVQIIMSVRRRGECARHATWFWSLESFGGVFYFFLFYDSQVIYVCIMIFICALPSSTESHRDILFSINKKPRYAAQTLKEFKWRKKNYCISNVPHVWYTCGMPTWIYTCICAD